MVNQQALNERLNKVPKMFVNMTSLGEHPARVNMRWAIITEVFNKGRVSFTELRNTFGFSERELTSLLVPLVQNYIHQEEVNGEYIYQPYEPGHDYITGFFAIIDKNYDKDVKKILDQIPERMMIMEPDSWL